ncbi:co-chaperone GroES family protein [Oligoflexia bacterium]|nr:co-chaperone GroES family protein [Oligoflexia bacterium]
MSDENSKKKNKLEEQDALNNTSEFLGHRQSIRSIHPLGMRVVVKICAKDKTTDGGLYLPDNAKDRMSESLVAEVLEVASAIEQGTDEETNISGIPLGAVVLIHKNAGTKVPWDESLRIVDTKDVLAIVEELNIT